MSYSSEFPGFRLAVAIPEDFEDTSWHNDACPSFVNTRLGLRVWVDYQDPRKSDMGQGVSRRDWNRFTVMDVDAEGENVSDTPLLETSDFGKVLRLIGLRRRSRGHRAAPAGPIRPLPNPAEETPRFATLREKIRWDNQRRETEHRTWKALLEEAHQLAMVAGEITTPDTMVVTTPGGREIARVDEGPCGFAWVNFFPEKGGPSRRFANWVTGKTDSMSPPPIRAEFSSYGGGVRIWVSAFNQSMQRKENYARHLADTLQRMFPDAKAYMNSRMD